MKLYTSKVVAAWLDISERRVRQLRDKGILEEKFPGLYELQPTIVRYLNYIRKGSNDLNNEKIKLTKAKCEAVEMENALRKGELHRTEDIEQGIQTICLNIRSRFLSLPAKLSPELSKMDGDQGRIFDTLKRTIEEILEELRDYRKVFESEESEKK